MAISNQQVSLLVHEIFASDVAAASGRRSYFRTLIEATQEALKPTLKGLDAHGPARIGMELNALAGQHSRFYELVLAEAGELVPKTQKGRPVTMHKMANFARKAMGAIRGHILAGGSVLDLVAAKATESGLKTKPPGPPRDATVLTLTRRAEQESKAFMATIMALSEKDQQRAIDEMQSLIGQLAQQLVMLGVISTKDAQRAANEHIPLRRGKTLFLPTQTQVIKQRLAAVHERGPAHAIQIEAAGS